MGALNLPPVPAELKPITPYLQRAEEVKATDPIIAYWCAYHAAQIGISLKVKEPNARTFLFNLLGTLEALKADIGPNDAIDDESASSAYVENFALRVFSMADNEDRKGNATRGTAKKFLAAANFLEVLSVVATSTPPTINVPEKIRYAKWKAADIAKAFREGRKPTPGGAGEEIQPEEQLAPAPEEHPATPPAINRSPSGPITDMPTSPPIISPNGEPVSPGEWSTVATPGANTRNEEFPSQAQSAVRKAWVSEDLEGTDAETLPSSGVHQGLVPPEVPARPEISPSSSDSGVKKVHFTPSVTGGLTPAPPLDTNPVLPPGFVPSPVQPPPPSLPSGPPPVVQSPSPPPPILSYPAQPQHQSHIPAATPEDLTPQVIARVQKHCKFAISALDYEDAEQARKELRAALRMLGG
ncbi:Vta1 like-domain-containing protein [Irpex lacteus]|nr:Vta1 like-domain-containing protein [Irpex lacteus]